MDQNSTDWRSQQFFVTKNGKKELIKVKNDINTKKDVINKKASFDTFLFIYYWS